VFLLFLLGLKLKIPKSFTGKAMPELEQQGEANSWLPAGSEHITISYLEQPSIIPALGAPVLSE